MTPSRLSILSARAFADDLRSDIPNPGDAMAQHAQLLAERRRREETNAITASCPDPAVRLRKQRDKLANWQKLPNGEHNRVARVMRRLAQIHLLDEAQALAIEHKVPLPHMLSRLRHRVYIIPRHALWNRMREKGFSLHDIGEIVFRDHTTVLHGTQRKRSQTPSAMEAT